MQEERSTFVALLLILIAAVVLFASPARADTWGDIRGMLTDPLKLGKSTSDLVEISKRVEQMLGQLRQLENISNAYVEARLEQIRSILAEVNSNVNQTILAAKDAILKLEQQIYRDANRLLYAAQCALEVAVTEQLNNGMAEAVTALRKSSPGIYLFNLIPIATFSANDIQKADPDKLYIELKLHRLQALDKIKADDPAYEFVSTYQNIARMAYYARCHYLRVGSADSPLAMRFTEEMNELDRLSHPWSAVLSPAMSRGP